MTIIPSASRRPQVELSPNEKILEAAATAATLIACGGKESAEDKIRELIQKNLRDMDPRVIQTLEGLKNSTSLDSAKLWLERLKALLVV